MPRHAQLNNIDHRDLRVVTARGAAWGDDVMSALTFPAEFRSVQAYYPIVFQKSADGSFQPVALFGFHAGQNLFLNSDVLRSDAPDGQGWDAAYVPLSVQRQPFLIGRSEAGELVVHIDLDHPRVGHAQGEPLFRAHGGTTDVMEHAASVLQALHDGLGATPAFVAALLREELLESFVLDVESGDGQPFRLAGFYTIHEERLGQLAPETLATLQRDGHLEAIYMAMASLSHFRDLIDRARRVHAGGA